MCKSRILCYCFLLSYTRQTFTFYQTVEKRYEIGHFQNLRKCFLHGFRQFLSQSFRKKNGKSPCYCGNNPHDENRSRKPVDLEQIQQKAGYSSDPSHKGACADCLVSNGCRKHLSCVHIHNSK